MKIFNPIAVITKNAQLRSTSAFSLPAFVHRRVKDNILVTKRQFRSKIPRDKRNSGNNSNMYKARANKAYACDTGGLIFLLLCLVAVML